MVLYLVAPKGLAYYTPSWLRLVGPKDVIEGREKQSVVSPCIKHWPPKPEGCLGLVRRKGVESFWQAHYLDKHYAVCANLGSLGKLLVC